MPAMMERNEDDEPASAHPASQPTDNTSSSHPPQAPTSSTAVSSNNDRRSNTTCSRQTFDSSAYQGLSESMSRLKQGRSSRRTGVTSSLLSSTFGIGSAQEKTTLTALTSSTSNLLQDNNNPSLVDSMARSKRMSVSQLTTAERRSRSSCVEEADHTISSTTIANNDNSSSNVPGASWVRTKRTNESASLYGSRRRPRRSLQAAPSGSASNTTNTTIQSKARWFARRANVAREIDSNKSNMTTKTNLAFPPPRSPEQDGNDDLHSPSPAVDDAETSAYGPGAYAIEGPGIGNGDDDDDSVMREFMATMSAHSAAMQVR